MKQMEAGLDLAVTVLVRLPVDWEQKQELDLVRSLSHSEEVHHVLDPILTV